MASYMLVMLSSTPELYPQPVYTFITEAELCAKTQAIRY